MMRSNDDQEVRACGRVAAPEDVATFTRLVNGLAFDESCKGRVPALASEARRFHQCRSGVVSVLFILLGLVFFCSGALVWNTGRVTAAKVHSQMAADTAAYTAAQWNARCVNNIVGTNMLILRQAAAAANSWAVFQTLVCIIDNWNDKAQDAYDVCCAACTLACAICGAACEAAMWIYILAVEGPPYLSFAFKAVPPAISELVSTYSDIGTLFDYEKAWIDALPEAIDNERKNVESYFGVKVRLTTPGVGAVGNGSELSGGISPPLVEASGLNMATIAIPLLIRYGFVDRGWPDDSWEFPIIVLGEAKDCWEDAMIPGVAIASILTGGRYHVLPTYDFGLEFGPTSESDWEDFQVVAAASEEGVAENNLIAPGLFNRGAAPGDTVTAIATGEVYNGIDGRVSQLGFSVPYPFRMWTTWGWQWQPRLGRSSAGGAQGALVRAMEYDATLKGLVRGVNNPAELNSVPMH